ncbi:hypothetical protein [Bacillus changyiensis]|uniref:hypothetical protein n=1 Tax=Bacillus changyiensis TaxID=3004103 RepID=UPI0022E0CAA4|nr:hypothetical protein [Bacillus changyiensis]MDA1477988.1 hypothetical protein [Bacillus changyiensis]
MKKVLKYTLLFTVATLFSYYYNMFVPKNLFYFIGWIFFYFICLWIVNLFDDKK